MDGKVIVDGQNVAEIENLGISLMAVEDKIIVMFDEYKSGYECTNCKGVGFIFGCPICDNVGLDRFQQTCKICNGLGIDYKIQCSECKGKGGLLVIPDNAKSLPTTGIVLSMGPDTPAMIKIIQLRDFKEQLKNAIENDDTDLINKLEYDIKYHNKELNNIPIRLGARVIFGPHVGTMIPFKGNIKLKIMRVHEPLAVIFGKDTAARDFIDYETEQY